MAERTWRTHREEDITTAELYLRCAVMLERAELPGGRTADRARTVAAIILYGQPAAETRPALQHPDRRPGSITVGPLDEYDKLYGPLSPTNRYERQRSARVFRQAAAGLAADARNTAPGQ